MSSGEIRRIGLNPPQRPGPQVLGQHEVKEVEPQILDKTLQVEQPSAQIVQHEEVVIEGQDKIRRTIPNVTDPQVRLRSHDTETWSRVKRLED